MPTYYPTVILSTKVIEILEDISFSAIISVVLDRHYRAFPFPQESYVKFMSSHLFAMRQLSSQKKGKKNVEKKLKRLICFIDTVSLVITHCLYEFIACQTRCCKSKLGHMSHRIKHSHQTTFILWTLINSDKQSAVGGS